MDALQKKFTKNQWLVREIRLLKDLVTQCLTKEFQYQVSLLFKDQYLI